MARRKVYGYQPQISSKYLDKGIICEQESINLYNEVYFKSAQKNTERRNNTCLTGECDLVVLSNGRITDIKSCWSLETFPETKRVAAADAKKAGYDWQIRAYMWLWDMPLGEVAYCMVSTPEDLLSPWDDVDAHYVEHIDPALRITTVQYERNKDLEVEIAIRVGHARRYYEQVVQEILNDHA